MRSMNIEPRGNPRTRFIGSPAPSRPPRSHAGAFRVAPRIGGRVPMLLPFRIRPLTRQSLSPSSCHSIVSKLAAVLAALGEDAPDAFLTKAEALGAAGFIESPLSLKLLRKALVGGDDWPTTRYDLFETAIRRL